MTRPWLHRLTLLGLLLTRLFAASPEEDRQPIVDAITEWEQAIAHDPKLDPSPLAQALHRLALLDLQLDQPPLAETSLRRALSLYPPDHPDALDAREALAVILLENHEPAEAIELLESTLATREELRTPSTESFQTRLHLAQALLQSGNYQKSRTLAAALLLTPDISPVQTILAYDLAGRIEHSTGNYRKALEHFDQAYTSLRRLQPSATPIPQTLESTIVLNISLSRTRLGDTEGARELLETSLLSLTPQHPSYLATLNNLAALEREDNDLQSAIHHFREIIEYLESNDGSSSHRLINPLHQLAATLEKNGETTAALAQLDRASLLSASRPPSLRTAQLAFDHARLSLRLQHPSTTERVHSAQQQILSLLDELLNSPSETAKLHFLQQIDPISLPCLTGNPDTIASTLVHSKARILDSLLNPSSTPSHITLQSLRLALQPGDALVDFARYRPANPAEAPRYGAIILTRNHPPRWIPLPSEPELQRLLSAIHHRIHWLTSDRSSTPPPLRLQGLFQALLQQLWLPIQSALPQDTRQLAICPDGLVHNVPWAALLHSHPSPLHHFDQLVTVTSSRDLLLPPSSTSLREYPWLLAGTSKQPNWNIPQPSHLPPSISTLSQLPPLPGTPDELRQISYMAPTGSLRLLDDQALESTFHLPATGRHAVIHLATHGFLTTTPTPSPPSNPSDFDAEPQKLDSCGLVLWPNSDQPLHFPSNNPSDGILYPREIAHLPLSHTRLVTLSCCDSGQGTILQGEDLLGLRRAFCQAGASEVMVSLWPVSDRFSPTFMRRFYQLALHSNAPAAALWTTQRELLHNLPQGLEGEETLVRYAPFVLSQTGPIIPATTTWPAPSPPPLASPKTLTIAASLIPLGLFFTAKFLRARRTRLQRDFP